MTSVEVSGFERDVKESMFNLSLKRKGQTWRSHMTLETAKDVLLAYLNKHFFVIPQNSKSYQVKQKYIYIKGSNIH